VTSDALVLYAVVIVLLPMVCFFLSAPAFLLVGLEIPEVMQLLRGIFNGYFLVMGITGAVATVLSAAAGRPSLFRRPGPHRGHRARVSPLVPAAHRRRAGGRAPPPATRRLRACTSRACWSTPVLLAAVVACVPLIV
jgi:hypothetical protein